jgi:arylsulfatase A-like enzyme
MVRGTPSQKWRRLASGFDGGHLPMKESPSLTVSRSLIAMTPSRTRSRLRHAFAMLPLIAAPAFGEVDVDRSIGGNGRSIVLISIDSLRADHCTPYGYKPKYAPEEQTTPFLAQLAQSGALFLNASAPSPWTLPSHVSLMTGMSCAEHGVRNRNVRLSARTEQLSGALRRSGYATAGFYSAPFLHPDWGFGQGFDHYEAATPYLQHESSTRAIWDTRAQSLRALHAASHSDARCSERVVDAALRWLEDRGSSESPFFLFLHLWDPHYDYEPPPEYARRFLPKQDRIEVKRLIQGGPATWSRPELDRIRALYDAEIRYTDDQIARLFGQLEEMGLAEQVVFAVTSDHGEEFFEHGGTGHQKTLFEEVMHVPLIVRASGTIHPGTKISATVPVHHLAATLLDLAGITPEALDSETESHQAWGQRSGASLLGLLDEPQRSRIAPLDLWMPGSLPRFLGLREGSQKIIVDPRQQSVFLFDLERDPAEQAPRTLAPHQLGSLLKPELAERVVTLLRGDSSAATDSAEPMQESAEMNRRLEALGYVGSAAAGSARD